MLDKREKEIIPLTGLIFPPSDDTLEWSSYRRWYSCLITPALIAELFLMAFSSSMISCHDMSGISSVLWKKRPSLSMQTSEPSKAAIYRGRSGYVAVTYSGASQRHELGICQIASSPLPSGTKIP